MIRTTELWMVVCDMCGTSSQVYSSQYKALDETARFGRWIIEKDRHICRSCVLDGYGNESD